MLPSILPTDDRILSGVFDIPARGYYALQSKYHNLRFRGEVFPIFTVHNYNCLVIESCNLLQIKPFLIRKTPPKKVVFQSLTDYFYLCTMFEMKCNRCGAAFEVDAVAAVNTERNPELKEKLISGELFVRECPQCGARLLAKFPLLYHDPAEKLMIWLSDGSADTEARMQAAVGGEDFAGYTGRIVDTPGALIEKVKIFDAGLDDISLEMAKFVTRQELGKDVALLFFGLDGADNEITLTYPEAGQMQLVKIGFNVYEDCAGIILRNPDIKKSATGLCRVDRGFVERWLR